MRYKEFALTEAVESDQQLLARCQKILWRLISAMGPDRMLFSTTHIALSPGITANDTSAWGNQAQIVRVDPGIFAGAPDSVLAVIIGHELGHLAKDHNERFGKPRDFRPTQANRAALYQDEYDADDYGVKLATRLGYTGAEVFKWVSQQKHTQEIPNPDPTSDVPKGELDTQTGQANFYTSAQQNTHPSDSARKIRANQRNPGFKLGANTQLDVVGREVGLA